MLERFTSWLTWQRRKHEVNRHMRVLRRQRREMNRR